LLPDQPYISQRFNVALRAAQQLTIEFLEGVKRRMCDTQPLGSQTNHVKRKLQGKQTHDNVLHLAP